MTPSTLLDAQVQMKRMYNALSEALELTRQLAEAMDRDDQVSMQMLISMREEPVKVIRQVSLALDQQRDSMGEADQFRFSQLLKGEPPGTPEEEPLARQVGANRRVLRQVQELDKILNLRLAREKSIYRQEGQSS